MDKMVQPQSNLFTLLRDRNILDIIDGDSEFGSFVVEGGNSEITISMPYLSGPQICNISNKFGLAATYGWSGGAKSRWMYLDDLFEFCIDNGSGSDLLSFLFSKSQFIEKLKRNSASIIDYAYLKITSEIINQINGILYFGGNELVRIGHVFHLRGIASEKVVETPIVTTIDRSYIKDISNRAQEDIASTNYDSAITKSRTLLEEVFCYVIEKKDENPLGSGNISHLYKQVKQLYNMHQNEDFDKRVNNLLSGLEKILSSITEMRNRGSDSHGLGARRIRISEHHARLFVNCAMTMAEFILAVSDKENK